MRYQLLFVLLAFTQASLAQENIREEVYVHSNSQTVITGETLSFSAYCRSASSGMPSRLSKFIYVELVGKDGPIFQEKWKLEKGRGFGEFFVSSNIESGRYHLIAYTRWMKNFGEYFSAEVNIVNPFEEFEPNMTTALELKVTPAHGQIVVGIENTLGLMVKGNRSQKFKGRVVDGSGSVEGNFELDEWGIGLVKFSPESEKEYQIILENQHGEFSFFPMPAIVPSGYSLQLYSDPNNLTIGFQASNMVEKEFKLRIQDKVGVIFLDQIRTNEVLKIALSKFDRKNSSPLQIFILDEFDTPVVSRTISLSTTSTHANKVEIRAGTRQVQPLDLDLPEGHYSVSIRKLDQTFSSGSMASDYKWAADIDYNDEFDLHNNLASSDSKMNEAAWILTKWKGSPSHFMGKLLPEVREELVSGVLLSKENIPVSDKYVAISLFQEPFQLRVAKTAQDGRFVLPYQSVDETVDAYMYPVDIDSSYQIKMENPFLGTYPDFNYNLPEPDSLMVTQIIERSIRVQIENAFYQPKNNSKKIPDSWLPQFRFDFVYKLDDYTRFKTLKETFTEYIVTANVREKRMPLIKAYFLSSPDGSDNPTLVLLDGVIVSPDKLIDFSPYEIESISVQNSRNYLGSLISDGVVSFISKEGRLGGFSPGFTYVPLKIAGLRQSAIIHSPRYLNSSQSKLPDQRDQLYWNPLLEVADKESSVINFHTSDLSGHFRVIVNGFVNDGTPLSRKIDFEVLDHH